MKVRQTKPVVREEVRITPMFRVTQITIQLTSRFTLEAIDPAYKYNSVEIIVGMQAEIPKDADLNLARQEFSKYVRAAFEEEMTAKIEREIRRINGDE